MLLDDDVNKVAQSFSFDVEITGRPNELCEIVVGEGADFFWRKHTRSFEVCDGKLHIPPRSVLREDGSDANFKRRIRRPPLKMTVCAVHKAICLAEGRHGGRDKDRGFTDSHGLKTI